MHPKTGKVCVPIDPESAWEFDPDDVPTVQQLLQEINEQQTDGSASAQQQVRTLQSVAMTAAITRACVRSYGRAAAVRYSAESS